jgi:uncharacterized protein (TIGR02996 family)
MSSHEAFLADVIENPDDDAPRLVYADWLDEHGESERGELIRVQCRLARLGDADPARAELERQERELLEAHGAEWAEPLRRLVQEFQYRRGFVEAVEVLGSAGIGRRLRRAMELAPVRSLRLFKVGEEMAELTGVGPCLRRLGELYVYAEDGAVAPIQLFGKRRLAGLTSFLLDCDDGEIEPDDVTDLFEVGVLPRLERLGLHLGYAEADEDADVLAELIEAEQFVSLRTLHLPFFALAEYAVALGSCPALSALEELGLRDCSATEEGWRGLLWSQALGGLRRLALGGILVRTGREAVPMAKTELGREVLRRFPGVADFNDLDDSPGNLPSWQGLTFPDEGDG